MFQLLFSIVAIPFALFSDIAPKQKKSDLEVELTRASYGAIMMILAGWLVLDPIPINFSYRLPAVATLMFWGIFWMSIGAARSRGPRDMRLIVHAAIKVSFGVFLYTLRWSIGLRDPLPPYGYFAVVIPALWLMITGGVKLTLLLRGRRTAPPRPAGVVGSIGGLPRNGFGDGSGFEE